MRVDLLKLVGGGSFSGSDDSCVAGAEFGTSSSVSGCGSGGCGSVVVSGSGALLLSVGGSDDNS